MLIRNAAAVAKGLNVAVPASNAPKIARYPSTGKCMEAASIAAVAKMSNGIVSGNTSMLSSTPPRLRQDAILKSNYGLSNFWVNAVTGS